VKHTFTDNNESETGVKKIAFVHHKGGTGKTTSCLNIAGWLAKMGRQVLVVDLDPQGNATTGLGIDRKKFAGQFNLLRKIKQHLFCKFSLPVKQIHRPQCSYSANRLIRLICPI